MAEEKKVVKVKLATAKKRILQSDRCNQRNRSYKAKVTTTMRSFKESIDKKDSPSAQANLAAVFSLMDKGVKTGVFKENKAGRVKSRLTQLARSIQA